MAEYLIQDTTLTGIADAIRSKTGSTDAIKVSDMASKIEGISVGGGTVEGVHYVTFMSEDGSTELYKRPVADGDDCADPVDRGLISAPTKESTAQYDYSFVGWATSPNGAWDENALEAVTEDKTVYAAFASVVMYYTATFYDGDTVIGTSKAAYGTKAIPPAYEKPGYTLNGWTPSDLTLYKDTDFVGSWSKVSGYEFVCSLTTSAKYSVVAVAVNKAGTRMAVASSSAGEGPYIYDITGDTPTLIKDVAFEYSIMSGGMYYSDDGSKLFCISKVDSSYRTVYPVVFDTTDDNYTASIGNALTNTSTTTATRWWYAKSPVDNGFAFSLDVGNYYAGIWNDAGTRIVNLTGSSSGYVYYMSYSFDGEYIATGYRNGNVKIYKSGGSLYTTITVASSSLNAVTFSSDNSKIAVYCGDGLYVYDVATGAKLIDVNSELSDAVAIWFVTGTNDLVVRGSASSATVPTVRVFDVSNNTLQEIENIPTFGTKGFAMVQPSLDGRFLAFAGAGGKTAELWRKL